MEGTTGIAITDGIGSTEMMHIFVSAAGDACAPAPPEKPCRVYERGSSMRTAMRSKKASAASRSRARPGAAISMMSARPIMSRTAGT